MGYPLAGLFIRENPYTWMMTGGSPILGNPHMVGTGSSSVDLFLFTCCNRSIPSATVLASRRQRDGHHGANDESLGHQLVNK